MCDGMVAAGYLFIISIFIQNSLCLSHLNLERRLDKGRKERERKNARQTVATLEKAKNANRKRNQTSEKNKNKIKWNEIEFILNLKTSHVTQSKRFDSNSKQSRANVRRIERERSK